MMKGFSQGSIVESLMNFVKGVCGVSVRHPVGIQGDSQVVVMCCVNVCDNGKLIT